MPRFRAQTPCFCIWLFTFSRFFEIFLECYDFRNHLQIKMIFRRIHQPILISPFFIETEGPLRPCCKKNLLTAGFNFRLDKIGAEVNVLGNIYFSGDNIIVNEYFPYLFINCLNVRQILTVFFNHNCQYFHKKSIFSSLFLYKNSTFA